MDITSLGWEGLSSFPRQERDEVLNDIHSHIAEATLAGAPLDRYSSLGPPDRLARIYCLELRLNPGPGHPQASKRDQALALASLLVLASVPTLVIVTTLGAVGFSLLFSGAVVFLAGTFSGMRAVFPLSGVDEHRVLALAAGILSRRLARVRYWRYITTCAGLWHCPPEDTNNVLRGAINLHGQRTVQPMRHRHLPASASAWTETPR